MISKSSGAFRLVAAVALLAIFLATSADFRKWLAEGSRSAIRSLDRYAPYSYVGVVAVILAVFLISLSRGTGER